MLAKVAAARKVEERRRLSQLLRVGWQRIHAARTWHGAANGEAGIDDRGRMDGWMLSEPIQMLQRRADRWIQSR